MIQVIFPEETMPTSKTINIDMEEVLSEISRIMLLNGVQAIGQSQFSKAWVFEVN